MISNDYKDCVFNFFSHYDKEHKFNNPLTLGAWLDCLAEFSEDIEEIEELFKKAVQKYKFWPTPEEVIALADQDLELSILTEWTSMRKSFSSSNITYFSAEAELAIESLGGRYYLSYLSEKDLAFVQKEFVAKWLLYHKALKRGEITYTPPSPRRPPYQGGMGGSVIKEEDLMPPEQRKELMKRVRNLINNNGF